MINFEEKSEGAQLNEFNRSRLFFSSSAFLFLGLFFGFLFNKHLTFSAIMVAISGIFLIFFVYKIQDLNDKEMVFERKIDFERRLNAAQILARRRRSPKTKK